MPSREQKVWGHRWPLRQDSTHQTDFLELVAGTRCSWHRHRTKANLFFLISGHVGVRTPEGETFLKPRESVTVQPGIWHEFRVYEDSQMIEEMYVAYDEGDIERTRPGGPLEE